MGGPRSTNWGEEERLYGGKETTKKTGGWILGWILEKWDGVMWTGLVWLRIETGGEVL
jgi:hypothetical protein